MISVEDESDYQKLCWPPKGIEAGTDDYREVQLLEILLDLHGYSTIYDGIYAESLERKVRRYQEDTGLPVTGQIGSEDWRSLLKLPAHY